MENYCPCCKKISNIETKLLLCKELPARRGYDLSVKNQTGKFATFPVQKCCVCGTIFVPK